MNIYIYIYIYEHIYVYIQNKNISNLGNTKINSKSNIPTNERYTTIYRHIMSINNDNKRDESEKVVVNMHGYLLAALLREVSCKTPGSREGVLYGNQELVKEDVVTDEMEEMTKFRTEAYISGYYMSGTRQSFYSQGASIDNEKLDSLIEYATNKKFIGWFIARRNSALQPTLRDIAISRTFNDYLKDKDYIGDNEGSLLFIIGLDLNNLKSVQSFSYRCYYVPFSYFHTNLLPSTFLIFYLSKIKLL